MFVIVKVTRKPHIDEYGEFDYEYEFDNFVGFSEYGMAWFSYENRRVFNDREEAKAVVERLRQMYDNSKLLYSRIHFEIEEVKAA